MIEVLRSVRFGVGDLAPDGLSVEDRQQRKANRSVLVLVLVVLGLLLSSLGLWKVMPHKAPQERIVIPLSGKK